MEDNKDNSGLNDIHWIDEVNLNTGDVKSIFHKKEMDVVISDHSNYTIEVTGLKAGDKYVTPKPLNCQTCGQLSTPIKHSTNVVPETVLYKCTNPECGITECKVLEK